MSHAALVFDIAGIRLSVSQEAVPEDSAEAGTQVQAQHEGLGS